ncbi:MAG: hypothetical protein QXO15_08640 [Nitrososphaerota archaeon]
MVKFRGIKVEEEVYFELLKLKSELMLRERRHVSISEVIRMLVDFYKGKKDGTVVLSA